LRLSDYKKKSQKEGAKSMRISQQTFSRILQKARKTLADALVNGKRIRIQGGHYLVTSRNNFPPKATT
jgi:predicted DNA-binding protein (UPF0251 family)